MSSADADSELDSEKKQHLEEEALLIALFQPPQKHHTVSDNCSDSERDRVQQQIASVSEDFLRNTNVNRPDVHLDELATRFSKTEVPEGPLKVGSVQAYINQLVQQTVNESVNTASPSMIGHMTSSLPYFMRSLSSLITTLNQNCVKTETASTVTFLEREAVAQLHRSIFKDIYDQQFYDKYSQAADSALGVFTSGGTLANITAIWSARNTILGPTSNSNGTVLFEGIEKVGVFDAMQYYNYRGAAVIGSKLLHYSLGKATDILGFGSKCLRSVDYDEDFRVKIDSVEKEILECKAKGLCIIAIIGIAGATETGSIDDLDALADLAAKYKVHYHVDAAWGGPGVFSKKQLVKLKGIERADTVTLDGHKQLYMPMGCGLCFFRDPRTSRAVQKSAKYIIRKGSYDLGQFTLEGSRPANAVYLHSNLNILGIRGYEILVDRSIRICQYMADKILQSSDFELMVKPATNILLYRALPKWVDLSKALGSAENKAIDEYNVRLQSVQKLKGRTFVSRTTVFSPRHQMHVVGLRVVIANPLTYEADIDRVLDDQRHVMLEIGESSQAEAEADSGALSDTSDGATMMATRNTAYWQDYWDSMPQMVRALFKNDKDTFLRSLVAPENSLNDESGGLLNQNRLL